jgi:hypothetical protein
MHLKGSHRILTGTVTLWRRFPTLLDKHSTAGAGPYVTPEPDGTPEISIVPVGLDADEIVAAHLPALPSDHAMVRITTGTRQAALQLSIPSDTSGVRTGVVDGSRDWSRRSLRKPRCAKREADRLDWLS